MLCQRQHRLYRKHGIFFRLLKVSASPRCNCGYSSNYFFISSQVWTMRLWHWSRRWQASVRIAVKSKNIRRPLLKCAKCGWVLCPLVQFPRMSNAQWKRLRQFVPHVEPHFVVALCRCSGCLSSLEKKKKKVQPDQSAGAGVSESENKREGSIHYIL